MGSAAGDWKALYQAAKRGDVAAVRQWLGEGVDPDLQHVEMGTTALIVAVEQGHLEVVKALVEGGADVTLRSDWEGCTALETALEFGREEIAGWLRAQSAAGDG